jgi:hypothetical protein
MNLFKANIRFDGERTCLHYYLCAYLAGRIGHDPLSESIINFKNGNPEHIQAWIDCAVKRLRAIRPSGFLIIRALGSDETEAAPDLVEPLDLLGRAIAEKYKGKWIPQLLSKTRCTKPLHRISTREERYKEMANVNRVNSSLTDLKGRWILLIDDVVTTGVTARYIIRALKAVDKSVFVIVFSLARTDYDPGFNQQLDLQGDNYSWNDNQTWALHEPEPFYLPKLLAEQDKNFDFGNSNTFIS